MANSEKTEAIVVKAVWKRLAAVSQAMGLLNYQFSSSQQALLDNKGLYRIEDDVLLERNAVKQLQSVASALLSVFASLPDETAQPLQYKMPAGQRQKMIKLNDEKTELSRLMLEAEKSPALKNIACWCTKLKSCGLALLIAFPRRRKNRRR